jgi:hypothetical protein
MFITSFNYLYIGKMKKYNYCSNNYNNIFYLKYISTEEKLLLFIFKL